MLDPVIHDKRIGICSCCLCNLALNFDGIGSEVNLVTRFNLYLVSQSHIVLKSLKSYGHPISPGCWRYCHASRCLDYRTGNLCAILVNHDKLIKCNGGLGCSQLIGLLARCERRILGTIGSLSVEITGIVTAILGDMYLEILIWMIRKVPLTPCIGCFALHYVIKLVVLTGILVVNESGIQDSYFKMVTVSCT